MKKKLLILIILFISGLVIYLFFLRSEFLNQGLRYKTKKNINVHSDTFRYFDSGTNFTSSTKVGQHEFEILAKTVEGNSITSTEVSKFEKNHIIFLKENQVCNYFKNRLNVTPNKRRGIFKKMIKSKYPKASSALVNKLNILEGKVSEKTTSEIEMFYMALSYAGLLNEGHHKDIAKANKLFKKLQDLDSENGAYYYFNLSNLKTNDSLTRELSMFSKSLHFNFHYSSLYRELWDNTMGEFSLFMAGQDVINKVAYPDFKKPYKIILRNLSLLEEPTVLLSYLRNIISKNLKNSGIYIDLSWSPVELVFFTSLHKHISKHLGIGLKKFKTYKEILNEISPARERVRANLELLKSNCTLKNADKLMDSERYYYQEFKNQEKGE